MKKVLAIARAEYLQAVRSKAFLIGLLVMPVLMGGGIAFQLLVGDQVDLRERVCAVVDPTGELWPVLAAAAESRNSQAIWEAQADGARQQLRPQFMLERYEPAADQRADVVLSQRVEAGELQGFVLVEPQVLDEEPGEKALTYYTEEPTFTELPEWIERVVNEEVQRRRFEEAGMDSELVAKLSRPLRLSTWGLVELRADGSVDEPEEENKLRSFGIPFAGLMLLFMFVMTAAPQLMNQVLEEKMQRISEVLISAVSPFQLMLGKLLAGVGVSLTLALIYLAAIVWALNHWNVGQFVPASAYAWVVLLLVFAMLTYGSIFSALGAACTELRDAQSLMMPVMIILMVPMFAWVPILESPNGTVAVALTYFPTATPMIFLVRLLSSPGPPAWEFATASAMCLATTLVFVWASGRIFRIGILAHGQAPSFRKLLGWVFSGA